MSMSMANGRVILDSSPPPVDFENLRREPTQKNFVSDALKGNIGRNAVSELFFSDVNIDALQLGMHNMVLNKSCGKYNIGRQSDKELAIIMRAIYLQDSVNSKYDVLGQVRHLNEQVLNFTVPRLINELGMHDTYLQDIQKMPVPMAYGQNTSVAGTKNLELTKL